MKINFNRNSIIKLLTTTTTMNTTNTVTTTELTTNHKCAPPDIEPQTTLSCSSRVRGIANDQCVSRRTNVIISRKQKGILNPAIISLVLIIYIISNQSLSLIINAGNNLSTTLIGEQYSNDAKISSVNNGAGFGFVNLVAAHPVPEPAARAGTTRVVTKSQRGPPMNGSIFGKRSADGETAKIIWRSISSK